MDFSIQELHALEVNMLPKFLYMAIFVPPGQNPLPFSVVNRPELLKYYEKWGREGDRAFIARVDGAPAGLIWCRLFTRDFHGYGFIAEDIPEVSMSVYPEFRGKGLGTALL
jgi:GNAT superfamily N-acetyltransferase